MNLLYRITEQVLSVNVEPEQEPGPLRKPPAPRPKAKRKKPPGPRRDT